MIEWIADFLASQGPLGVIAQLIGILGFSAGIVSFQQKTQRGIVIWQCVSTMLWSIHMLLIGAVAGMLLNVVGFARALVYACREKHAWARKRFWYVLFIALIAGSSLFSALRPGGEGWLALLPFAAMVLTTFALAFQDPFRVRLLTLANDPFWLTYNLLNRSFPGAISEICNMVSIIMAMIRLDYPKYRMKKEQKKTELSESK